MRERLLCDGNLADLYNITKLDVPSPPSKSQKLSKEELEQIL
jgi:hypothetical protein